MKAEDILGNAMIIMKDRGKTHGDKHVMFNHIAEFWNLYISVKAGEAYHVLEAHDVALMMGMLKDVRAMHSEPSDEHMADGAGYRAIAAELYAARQVEITKSEDEANYERI